MKFYKNLVQAIKERDKVTHLKLTTEFDFPTAVFDFPHLTELFLEGDCRKIPSISGLNELKLLYLKLPHLSGDLSPFFSLPKLENLKIIDTPIDTFALPLGRSLAPLTSLTIKNGRLNNLPEEISVLESLKEINFSGNKLSELPFSFKDLKLLKRLNLDQNHFTRFPDFIKKMKNLSHLSIDQNLFSDDEKARIQREFNLYPH